MDIKALAMFGSVARGDADSASDIDLLVIGSQNSVCPHFRSLLEGNGFEVSYYSVNRFLRMAARGDLFIHHVLSESRVLFDSDHVIDQAKSQFSFKSSYSREIVDAENLILVASLYPSSHEGRAWAADVLACAFRTFSVPFLAERGIHEYSHCGILDAMNYVLGIPETVCSDLHDLRLAKRRYRSGNHQVGERKLETFFRAVELATGVDGQQAEVTRNRCVEDLQEVRFESNYIRSRRVERLLVSLGEQAGGPATYLRRLVSLPSAYAASFSLGNRGDVMLSTLLDSVA